MIRYPMQIGVRLGIDKAPCCGCVIESITAVMHRPDGFGCDCRCHDTAKWLAKR